MWCVVLKVATANSRLHWDARWCPEEGATDADVHREDIQALPVDITVRVLRKRVARKLSLVALLTQRASRCLCFVSL
jgi:hypothetical protein